MAMEHMNEAASTTVGFRFSPSDEELVMYYLRNKIIGRPHRFEVIAEIDIYKSDPWDLPAHSLLKSRDNVWFFITALDKKYAVGSLLKRATPTGHWKLTGLVRQIKHRDRVVGTKKTLVFHSGRAPSGIKTDWVMHEYRLCDPELQNAGIAQDSYVLCKIMDKTEVGPDEMDGEDDEQADAPPPEMTVADDVANKIDGEAELDSSMPPSEGQRHELTSSSEEAAASKKLNNVDSPLNPSLHSRPSRQVSTSTYMPTDFDRVVPPEYIKYLSTLENQICNLKREVESLRVEAVEARSGVSALQSRIDELTMESVMLKGRASKID